MKKFNDLTKNGLDEWIYFLKTDEIKEGFKAKGLKEAKEKLDVLKLPKDKRAEYNCYLEDLHYKASIAQTQKYKLERSEQESEKRGEARGGSKR
ncbi:MAG: hypothetical protein U0354_08810 [Candidatus Sericytochromatia bacterium]